MLALIYSTIQLTHNHNLTFSCQWKMHDSNQTCILEGGNNLSVGFSVSCLLSNLTVEMNGRASAKVVH